jgi:hypothetical protein
MQPDMQGVHLDAYLCQARFLVRQHGFDRFVGGRRLLRRYSESRLRAQNLQVLLVPTSAIDTVICRCT